MNNSSKHEFHPVHRGFRTLRYVPFKPQKKSLEQPDDNDIYRIAQLDQPLPPGKPLRIEMDGVLRLVRGAQGGLESIMTEEQESKSLRDRNYVLQHAQFLFRLKRHVRSWKELVRQVYRLRLEWGVGHFTWRERRERKEALPYIQFLGYLNSPLMDALDAMIPRAAVDFQEEYFPLAFLHDTTPEAAAAGTRLLMQFRPPIASDVATAASMIGSTRQTRAMLTELFRHARQPKDALIRVLALTIGNRRHDTSLLDWFAEEFPVELDNPGWAAIWQGMLIYTNLLLIDRVYELRLQRHVASDVRVEAIASCMLCVPTETVEQMLRNRHIAGELPPNFFEVLHRIADAWAADPDNFIRPTVVQPRTAEAVLRTLRQMHPGMRLQGSERYQPQAAAADAAVMDEFM